MKSGWLERAVVAAGLLLCAMLPAAARQFDATSFTLANGLQVVVIPNHRAPIVTQMIWYKVGAADETTGKSGLAHFLEHLMFRGTKETPPGAFSRIIAENGGRGDLHSRAIPDPPQQSRAFHGSNESEGIPVWLNL